MFSISHSLLSIALPHVLLTVLISSTCTLLGTPSFPQYLSLSVSSCVCSFVRLSTSVLALSYEAFSVLVLSLSIYSLSPTSSSILPLSVSKYPLPLQSPSALEPRLRHPLPGSDPRLPPTSNLPTPWNHTFVCPDLTHACLTTTNLNCPLHPCLPTTTPACLTTNCLK